MIPWTLSSQLLTFPSLLAPSGLTGDHPGPKLASRRNESMLTLNLIAYLSRPGERARPANAPLDTVASDAVLDEAYAWLCRRRGSAYADAAADAKPPSGMPSGTSAGAGPSSSRASNASSGTTPSALSPLGPSATTTAPPRSGPRATPWSGRPSPSSSGGSCPAGRTKADRNSPKKSASRFAWPKKVPIPRIRRC